MRFLKLFECTFSPIVYTSIIILLKDLVNPDNSHRDTVTFLKMLSVYAKITNSDREMLPNRTKICGIFIEMVPVYAQIVQK